MSGHLQEGIYYQTGARPGKFFAIAFLAAQPDATASQAHVFLQSLWGCYQALKQGQVADLPGHPVPPDGLTVLLGYGPNVFRLSGTVNLPPELGPAHRFLSPRTLGGGPLLTGSGLAYADDISKNIATEAVMVQFIAETQLAAYRCIVETWKFLTDYESAPGTLPPFAWAGFYDGFQREDRRSWLDFHDGLSNLRSGDERLNAVRIKSGNYEDGSYLCFLRLAVDLPAWRKLNRRQQELLVGRNKLTGCPLTGLDNAGQPQAAAGCPLGGTTEVSQNGNEAFLEPPLVGNPMLRQSHVQRANLQHNQNISDPQSLRIFRQGYEFLENVPVTPGFRAGLNFVSFQDTPHRIIRLLTRQNWLGQTNFGGDSGSPLLLLSVRAAGIYLTPPLTTTESFPGETIFG